MAIEVLLRCILLDNINEYEINKQAKLINDIQRNSIRLIIEPNNSYESNSPLLKNAIDLSIPKVMISANCNDEVYSAFWKTRVFFSYYGDTELKYNSAVKIPKSNLDSINEWMKRFVETAEKNNKFTSWNVAYNEYLDAMDCSILEKAYMHLITALEALTITGNVELNYRVSLNTAMLCGETIEERKTIFQIVKKAYSLRSATVHGDIDVMKKKFKDENLYDLMFDLREIVSKVLNITYAKEKDKVIEDIESKIFL